jgi:hypothetical protein
MLTANPRTIPLADARAARECRIAVRPTKDGDALWGGLQRAADFFSSPRKASASESSCGPRLCAPSIPYPETLLFGKRKY